MLQMCLGTVYAWSFFQTMLARQYGWNNTETVLSFCLAIFFLGISAGWAGQMLPKWGPRVLALTGSVLFCAGYVIASLALQLDNVTLFYLGYGVIGGAGIGMGYVTPVVTVAKWFPDMRGLATGIVVMGFGVGALLLSKVLAPFLVVRADSDLATVFLWLGIVFACILIPCSLMLSNPEEEPAAKPGGPARAAKPPPETESARPYLFTGRFAVMWLVFFFNIAAGISVISFQSELLQEVWGLSDPSLEPAVLAEYGATLIAVSSVCNGVGRILWAWLSDRFGRVTIFRVLLASQMIVFGVLMSETNPWVFSVLVCYVLLCFGGGFATMPSFILEVFGAQKMSRIYGTILTAWSAAGISGPLFVGYLKDVYPDRAVMYCFLIGILMLGAGYIFSFLLDDERMRLGRPTLAHTLERYGLVKTT
ncbi:MAG: OFA family MFS transporter [Gemmatimonadetes bacterium]|nr:OFA family MFS transporter [Gemmatimonadota bacterium]MYC90817.1 OFA family MFS transporter [Gemmatimonadota bacterium]MYG36967.1 OFA family MFS transporter [Gemmatimonadota bacterium]MYJ16501.1 OFA family MFS transporter [Gemmatimonadota bacterium]